ncbi:MAG: hypothetical protein BWK76_06445 [Desulfobulbaceae bacterium A2]|nr:MAG: hypothetical protein BWK76_06445 [Desulfobulbaceae bacterium A2]
MSIRHRLWFLTALALLAGLLSIPVFVRLSVELTRIACARDEGDQLIQATVALVTINRDYLDRPDHPRPRQQILLASQRIRHLAGTLAAETAEPGLGQLIRQDAELLLQQVHEMMESPDSGIQLEDKRRSLLLGSQNLVDHTLRLNSLSQDLIARRWRTLGWLLGGFVVLLLASLTLGTLLLSRHLRRSLGRLQQGVHHFGQGNLEYRLQLAGRDELEELADDFNRMAEQLAASRRERQQALERLRSSEEKFRQLFDQAPIPMGLTNRAGEITERNRRFIDLLGYSAEDVPDLTSWWLRAYPDPTAREAVIASWQTAVTLAAATGGTIQPSAHSIRCRNGQIRFMEISGILLDDGILASFLDLTDRRRAEEELRASEARYRSMVNALSEGLLVFDPQGRIQSCNPAAERLLGMPMELMQHKSLSDWQPVREDGSPYPQTELPVARTLEDGRPRRDMVLGDIGPDGRLNWFLLNCEPVFEGQDNSLSSVVVSITDITRRFLAEQESRRLFMAVEQSPDTVLITDPRGNIQYVNPAFEATCGYSRQEASISPVRNPQGQIVNYVAVKRDISEELRLHAEQENLQRQLHHAQRLESVGRLAGGVAHDFNNKLGVILGRAELALMSELPDEALRQSLEEIRSAAMQSAELTRQLLAFARRQTILPRPLDLNDVITGLLKMLRRLIGEDIALDWIPGAELYPVLLDPTQVDQILANLAVNARDAIQGVGKLTIETANVRVDADYCARRPEAVPGDYVMISVSDTGSGMDQELQHKIFEPFFTTKEVGEGTGLGLATVYGIVKQNKGFVYLYSEPGQGSTFKIYLPRHTGTAQEADVAAEPLAIIGGTETILLVEDEGGIRNLAQSMLELLGYTVLCAENPSAALALADAHPGDIDLLLSDVVMPEMNGRELAERIRVRRPGIRCLFMSGYTADVIAHRGVLEQGTHFLPKPFSLDALAGKVREVLDSSALSINAPQ